AEAERRVSGHPRGVHLREDVAGRHGARHFVRGGGLLSQAARRGAPAREGRRDHRAAVMTLPDLLDEARALVDAELARRLPGDADDPGRLWEAMRYAVLGGGKRLRPALVLAAARAAGGTWEGALPAAAAVELLHAYTLVHDDLPAM